MSTPFFVIGLARSGTNLVARMLDRHPEVSVTLDPFMPAFRSLRDAIVRKSADECLQQRYTSHLPFQDYYFDALAPTLLDSVLAANLEMNLDGNELEFLKKACAERAALESPSLAEHMEKLSGQTYAELFDSMMTLLADQNPEAQWVGCKEVWIEDFVPVLARALPNSRFIAIERDPRAIIASLLALSQTSPSQFAHIPSYARHWRKGIALNRRHQRDADITGRFHLLSYESLVADAEGNAHTLCNFLGIDYWPGMTNLSEDGWRGNSGYAHAGRDVYIDSLDRWRISLQSDVTAAVDYLCAPEMRLTDYIPISSPCLDTRVARYLLAAGGESYSWRSDSGDEFADLAGEVLRYALINGDQIDSETLLRRCFLFPEIYYAIRNTDIKGAFQ